MDILITAKTKYAKMFGGQIKQNIGSYSILVKEPTQYKHYFGLEDNNSICFFFGNQYEQNDNDLFVKRIYTGMKTKKYREIIEMDGEFICGLINVERSTIELLTDREGIIPLYYRYSDGQWDITTEQELLYDDYTDSDINYHAVNDFLRFGTLIGGETFSKQVFRTRGGSSILYQMNGTYNTNRIYKFSYNESSSNHNMGDLIEEISKTYKNAILKRVKGKEEDTCIFMSGGMDSRYLLASSNKCLDKKLSTYCFGQEKSEEVNIARMCTELEDNLFEWVKIKPSDFVINAEVYERKVCGSDMFPQSYILNAIKGIREEQFLTGFALDAYLGGTFLDENIMEYKGTLEECISENLSLLKMNVFSKEELLELCINNKIGEVVFGIDTENLKKEAKEYDDCLVIDAIQPFSIDNRAKNLVLQRELIPAKYMDCSYVSCDRDFLAAVSKIPARFRLNHKFYCELYRETAKEYGKIVYNNTTLPVLTPVKDWMDGIRNEVKRELQFEKLMKKYNKDNEDKLYYPHYYSDFNGYSRYDDDWRNLFQKYLFAEDAFMTNNIFDENKVKTLYFEHINGEKNRRKELIYLTSLEIFFKNMLNKYKN